MRESQVMIQYQPLVESHTTTDELRITTNCTIQSIRWNNFCCKQYFRSFSYICTTWYVIHTMILSFTRVHSNHIPFHNSLNVGMLANNLKKVEPIQEIFLMHWSCSCMIVEQIWFVSGLNLLSF